jgi:hypothetical protein
MYVSAVFAKIESGDYTAESLAEYMNYRELNRFGTRVI